MSAMRLKIEVTKKFKNENYDFILTNFANPDMVGHTGNLKATVKAIEVVDDCIGEIYNECKKNGYLLIVTSDHGNADLCMTKKKLTCMYNTFN